MPLLGAALFALLVRNLPPVEFPKFWRVSKKHGMRLLAYQVYPRRLWAWWCGGLSVGDLCVVAVFVAANLVLLICGLKSYARYLDAVEASGIAFHMSLSNIWLERWALLLGCLMWPSLLLLFLPIPQSCFIQWITGLSHSHLIRYHRWMGHATMVIVSLHGILYYILWGIEGTFSEMFVDWGGDSSIIYLAGSISWFFGLILWGTSINLVRRALFNLFYRAHIVGFLGFAFFAYIHYSWSWSYFFPGLLLYAVDVVMRIGQLGNVTAPSTVKVSPDERIATLQLETSASMPKVCPFAELTLMIPSISRWQWHPFTIAATEDSESGGQILTVSMKRYGKYTQQLISRLAKRETLAMRVNGPFSTGTKEWAEYDNVVLVAGGIGATPLLSVLRHLIQKRTEKKSSKESSFPSKVSLIWVARHPSELEVMDASIIDAASNDWLDVDCYLTRAPSKKSGGGDSQNGENVLEKRKDSMSSTSSGGPKLSEEPAKAAMVVASGNPSPLYWNIIRKVQHQYLNDLHLAMIHIVVFFASWVAFSLAYMYNGEVNTYWGSGGDPDNAYNNYFYWVLSMVLFVIQFFLIVPLAYILVIFPVHVYRYYWKRDEDVMTVVNAAPVAGSTAAGCVYSVETGVLYVPGTDISLAVQRGRRADEELWVEPSQAIQLSPQLSTQLSTQNSNLQSQASDLSVTVQTGRPNVEELLVQASKSLGKGTTVGVFVAGPEALNRNVQHCVYALNKMGGAYFDFHKAAFEL